MFVDLKICCPGIRMIYIILIFLPQNFYKNEIDRQEMYIRYIYKLRDLHLASNNYTEAGFTLHLHADLLDWKTTSLPPDQYYPAQLEWQRKEKLYLMIINYFDMGKVPAVLCGSRREAGIVLMLGRWEDYEYEMGDFHFGM